MKVFVASTTQTALDAKREPAENCRAGRFHRLNSSQVEQNYAGPYNIHVGGV